MEDARNCGHSGQRLSEEIERVERKGKEDRGLRAVLGIRRDDGGLGAELCEGGGGAGGAGRVGAQLLQGVFVEVEGGDLDGFEVAHEAVGGGADEEGSEKGQAGADDA